MSIHTYIKDNQVSLCGLLQELVRIPTVNPPGENYAEIVELLEAKCKTLGMKTKVVKVPKRRAEQVISNASSHPRLNLIARWDVGAEKNSAFQCTLRCGASCRGVAFQRSVQRKD
jgi:succinyl-diaminopimelate desuccinylase